ncbi:MAG: Helix-turn-helix domain [Polyangiaceae bacterium]|jgi:excisionase family DNA binding protein|nr:Helix-turn-helix domain [Polyangiaceae bacterium]
MNTKDWADQAVAELPALCTSGEAAAFLRVSVRQLYRYLSVGKLPSLQHDKGSQVLIPRIALAKYLREAARAA